MEEAARIIELVAALSGIAYVVLEILQKRSMWYVGIITGAACAFSFCVTRVWASMALNIYYMVVSVVGLIQWKKDSEKVSQGSLHLGRMTPRVWWWSAIAVVFGTAAFYLILSRTGDSAPLLDSVSTMLSVVATWWLVKAYLPQWLLWVVADVITTSLCIYTGNYAMALMYLVYASSAVYGYFHWKRNGTQIQTEDAI